jgi:hypothetical protein
VRLFFFLDLVLLDLHLFIRERNVLRHRVSLSVLIVHGHDRIQTVRPHMLDSRGGRR